MILTELPRTGPAEGARASVAPMLAVQHTIHTHILTHIEQYHQSAQTHNRHYTRASASKRKDTKRVGPEEHRMTQKEDREKTRTSYEGK